MVRWKIARAGNRPLPTPTSFGSDAPTDCREGRPPGQSASTGATHPRRLDAEENCAMPCSPPPVVCRRVRRKASPAKALRMVEMRDKRCRSQADQRGRRTHALYRSVYLPLLRGRDSEGHRNPSIPFRRPLVTGPARRGRPGPRRPLYLLNSTFSCGQQALAFAERDRCDERPSRHRMEFAMSIKPHSAARRSDRENRRAP